jgi:uncharacterized membrane protein
VTTPITDASPVLSATHDNLAREGVPLRVGSKRIISLDIVRGVAMVVMAIDHVRVYSGQPAGGPTPGIFFTRWITNYSAPIFVFLAGTAAYLYGAKLLGSAGRRGLASWLVSRGAWLILLELTVLRFAWTFNFDYAHYSMAGVLWAIGWSMIGLAGLIYLPVPVILAVGLAIVAGHNLIDPHVHEIREALQGDRWAWVLQILYFGGAIDIHGSQFIVLYSIIPWVGLMATGYAFGAVMRWSPERRARYCYAVGALAVALFLVLRGFDVYGDPRPWHVPASGQEHVAPALLRFLNTTKYPASLLFLLMTIGPTLIAIPLLEHARGSIARVLAVFGRVPFFFYVLHIALIHLVALGVSLIRSGSISPWLFANHPVMVPRPPDGYTWSLPLLYLVWVLVTVTLYFPCRWYADLKARSDNPWLRYL